jgi:hypothetical protein
MKANITLGIKKKCISIKIESCNFSEFTMKMMLHKTLLKSFIAIKWMRINTSRWINQFIRLTHKKYTSLSYTSHSIMIFRSNKYIGYNISTQQMTILTLTIFTKMNKNIIFINNMKIVNFSDNSEFQLC